MKKHRKILALVACVAMAVAGADLIQSSGVYADAPGLTSIAVATDNGGTECWLYHSNSNVTSRCDSTYGSYDATNNIITLGSAMDGKALSFDGDSTSGNSYTVKTTEDITIKQFLGLPSKTTLTFDLSQYVLSNTGGHIGLPSSGNVILKSGTLDLSYTTQLRTGNFTVEDGLLNIDFNGDGLYLGVENVFTIDGGAVDIEDGGISADHAIINDGDIEIDYNTKDNNHGIEVRNEFRLVDGTVSINNASSGVTTSAKSDGAARVDILGGELNISNVDCGIQFMTGGKLNFSGGVTTINKSSKYAVYISESGDPENDIAFGDGMGIIEPEIYVFWYAGYVYDDYGYGRTGIVASDETVTIADGGTVRRVYSLEIDDDSDTKVPNTSGAKTPDTGVFSGENGGAAIVAISVGALIALAGGAYMTSYIVKRNKNSVKFDR